MHSGDGDGDGDGGWVQVRRLVDCCRWLQEVDVVGVRGLPRGCKVCALACAGAASVFRVDDACDIHFGGDRQQRR